MSGDKGTHKHTTEEGNQTEGTESKRNMMRYNLADEYNAKFNVKVSSGVARKQTGSSTF